MNDHLKARELGMAPMMLLFLDAGSQPVSRSNFRYSKKEFCQMRINKRYTPLIHALIMAFFMSLIMSLIMSLSMTLINVGLLPALFSCFTF
ncbi:MAG: DUF2798 domain-containing protein [Proteobacteria bacterium]|nr:DUF2798 domain-containing protein [Pseudomonadota bacterium]